MYCPTKITEREGVLFQGRVESSVKEEEWRSRPEQWMCSILIVEKRITSGLVARMQTSHCQNSAVLQDTRGSLSKGNSKSRLHVRPYWPFLQWHGSLKNDSLPFLCLMWAMQSGYSSLAITFKSGIIFHVKWSYQAIVILTTQALLKYTFKTKEHLPNSKLPKV